MLSPKQIGTICLSFFLILVSQKSYSDIAANNSNPSCDNSTLNTYTGPAALEAKWNANTIQLKWYKDDEQLTVQSAANQCTYDGTMTLPSTHPTKIGYDFNGWKVKTASSSSSGALCGLTNSGVTNATIAWDADYVAWKPINGSSGYTVAQAISGEYLDPGIDQSSSLSNGDWFVLDSSGNKYAGRAVCSEQSVDMNAVEAQFMSLMESGMSEEAAAAAIYATPAMSSASVTSSNNGQYCWCHAESYTPNAGNSCSVSSLAWVFRHDFESASNCASDCASYCAPHVQRYAAFRAAVFGVSGN